MSLQSDFLKDIGTKNDKIEVIEKYIKNINDNDINDNIKVDLKECNIYIEYATRKLITNRKMFSDLITAYIIIYHPKLFEYICLDKTIDEVIEIKDKLMAKIDNIYKDINKDNKYNICKKILTSKFKTENRNALEYCYFLTWARFDKDWVDVEQKYIIDNNKDDILCINITYGLQNLDSIVMYNNIDDSNISFLTEQLIKDTKRYEYIKPTTIADKPVSIYKYDFTKIEKINTQNVTILIDYGNGYYTRCFLNSDDIPAGFANDIIKGKVKCNTNKNLLFNIVNRDIYNLLPSNCYEEKRNKQELIKKYNTMKKIIIESFNDNRKECIKNILSHKDINNVIDKKELDVFKLYLKYLMSMENYNQLLVENYCCNYLYDGLFESKNLMDNN